MGVIFWLSCLNKWVLFPLAFRGRPLCMVRCCYGLGMVTGKCSV